MRAVQGAVIVASSVQIILGFSQMWAICSRYIHACCHIKRCRTLMIFFIFIFRFFSPVGMVPVIALTGFGLFNRGFPVVCLFLKIEESSLLGFLFWLCVLCLQVGTCVEIGIPMLILFVLFSQVIHLFTYVWPY